MIAAGPRASSRVRSVFVGASALAMLSCGAAPSDTKADPKPQTSTAGAPEEPADSKQPATTDVASADGDACTDYGTLDPATLPALPPSPHAALLHEVWVRVLQKHYDPKLGCKDWPALRMQYGEKLVSAKDEAAAYATINDMLGELGQSHFRLFAPSGKRDDEHAGPASPPIAVRWIEDQLVVVHGTASGHLGAVGPGSTLLAVDEVTFDDARAEIEGRTSRPAQFAFEIARVAAARLSCEHAGQSRKVRVTEPAAQKQVVRMLVCAEPKGERISLGNLEDIPTQVESRMIEGTDVGVLGFNVWMLPMVKRVEESMDQLRARGMRALVLDLRGNPGGVGAMSIPIARLLLGDPGSLGKLRFRDFTQEFKVEAGNNPFVGPVAVLVDEGTASTSEIFAAGMRDLGRVIIVGAGPSAGAALPSLIDELPQGAILQYVVGDYQSPKGTTVEGIGVVPDILVTETRADFAAGRDPVLEAAVAHLGKQLQESRP
jgi:carboxyl-terminal processing protease